MSDPNPSLDVKCIHCGQVFQISLADLERPMTVYRTLTERDPVEYLVSCPRCKQKNVIDLRLRGEEGP